jgi:DNA-directed RNA polymerase subunit RPC12/RpoP
MGLPWFQKSRDNVAPMPSRGPSTENRSTAAYACPVCGAVLRDTSLRVCTYCHSALFQETEARWTRIWHTDDGGATWSVRERKCAQCGATVANPRALTCAMCGAALAALAPHADPRPTASILLVLPPVPTAPGKVTMRIQGLVRYLENHWWPVPPSVPRAVGVLLPLLPDACPQCGSKQFRVALAPADSWQVLCSVCKNAPGTRSDAPPTFPLPPA